MGVGQICARLRAAAVLALTALLAGCGGGGGGGDVVPPVPGVSCTRAEQRLWLDGYFAEWYLWNRIAPDPNALRDTTVAEFFQASLYAGGDARFPPDRWSRMEPQAAFDRFFGEGRSLGYGLFLAGLEVAGQPGRPLQVRFVEAESDAAAQGVRRGDEVLSANGRSAAEMVAANDFAPFTAEREGDRLDLLLRRDGAERRVTLTASAHRLRPVAGHGVHSTPQGRRMGWIVVKDMISQAESPIASAFADFKAAGVQELAIDLRYNGGGLVSVARTLASHVSAARSAERVFVRLSYNDRRAAGNDELQRFRSPAAALDLQRVYVLTGRRTCSASELVVNGLRPIVEVVTVGDGTCGKPVGFLPQSRCDTTFNVVNFEVFNANDEGRYFDGIAPTCRVAEDLQRPLGSADEPLLAAAAAHADSGRCPAPGPLAGGAGRRGPQAAPGGPPGEPPERQGLWR